MLTRNVLTEAKSYHSGAVILTVLFVGVHGHLTPMLTHSSQYHWQTTS